MEILDESKLSTFEADTLNTLRTQVRESNTIMTMLQEKLRMFTGLVGNQYFKEGTCEFTKEGKLQGLPKGTADVVTKNL